MKMKHTNRLFKGALAVTMVIMSGSLYAQNAGDIISGVVEDSEGPMMAVNVIEKDAAGRIQAHDITDMEGNFSFRLVNPKDRLVISYVGYETVDIPINKTYFEITMKDNTLIEPVDIIAEKVAEGPLPIPIREMSTVQTTIDMSEFEDNAMTSVDEALQGRVPGLDIVFNSGDLGARSTMHLRGVATMTGDANPLIVVDGIIWEIDANLKNNFDYVNESQNNEKVSELLNINPDDIQTINVLRDAAATALYGSRGANGVMEIKTKRGSRGKTRVGYSYRLNASWQPIGYKLLNGDQYTMYLKEAFFNPKMDATLVDGIEEINYVEDFSEYRMYNNNTDWVGAVKQIGLQHGHNVTVDGGGEKANFYLSAGFDDQENSVIGQKLYRFTNRLNLDYFISERISISTSFNLTYSRQRNNSTAIGTAMRMMPNLAIYYEDKNDKSTGEFYHMLPTANENLPSNTNPIAEAAEKENYNTSLNVGSTFSVKYNLLGLDPGETQLSYNGSVNLTVSNSDGDQYTPQSLSRNGWSDSNANSVSSNASKNQNITTNHSLRFIPHLNNPNHSVMVNLSYELRMSNNKSQSGGLSGIPSKFKSIGLPGNVKSMSTGAGRSRQIGISGVVHYSYKSKYSVDFRWRTDGNTRFGDANRWATFPSVSGRWNVIDEKFMQGIARSGYLSMLGITGSWALQGNSPGSDGMFYSKYSSGDSYMGETSMKPDNIRLSTMQWEETNSVDFGINLGFFRDKINVNIQLYDRVTSNLLNSGYSIPSSSGFNSLSVVNGGKMRNQGWEFSLDANRIYSTRLLGQEFNIGGGMNLADNTNQILEMNPTMLEKMTNDFDYKNGSYLSYVALKNAFGSIYGFKSHGVYQYSKWSAVEDPGVSGPNAPVARDADGNVIAVEKNGVMYTRPMMYDYGTGRTNYEFVGGDAIYEDINYDGNINELDIVYLGSSLPKLNGGFRFNVSWGRLSWSNNFSFRYGNRIVNGSRMNAEAMYNTDNTSAAVNWRWRVEGDETVMPRALNQYGYNYLGSDRYVEDGSFLRWTSTNLGYNIDPKIVKKLHLSNIRLTANLNNVLTFTKYSGLDPESAGSGGRGSVAKDNSQTPRSKQVSFNVSVRF
jgi:TonB-linked SusC/RagA family outer membrane protein